MAENKIIGYDIDTPNSTGTDNVTTALRNLLNSYPLLSSNDSIGFQTLGETMGKAMFPNSSAAILTEKKDVIGHATQTCAYPFTVVYRASGLSEENKAKVKEWLDNLGRWLEKQPIKVNGSEVVLKHYPVLADKRKFLKISRQTPSYLYGTGDNKAEDWAISIQATYLNEYDE